MLEIIQYDKNNEAFAGLGQAKKALVITPNPQISDAARLNLAKHELSLGYSVLTISKFIADQLRAIGGEQRKKSELIKYLSIAWVNVCGDHSFNKFLTCFNLFTELRSFSTNLELFLDILDSYDELTQKALKSFWTLVDSLELIDEHKAYETLSNHLKESENFLDYENIIFWGFDHLSATQIDYLNSLSLGTKVSVLYSKKQFAQKKSTDWISWLFKEEVTCEPKQVSQIKAKVYRFPRYRLAQMDFSNDLKDKELAFASSSVDSKLLYSVPDLDKFFIEKQDIFQGQNKLLKEELKAYEGKEIKWVLKVLESKKELAFKKENFRLIKVISLYEEVILELQELSDSFSHLKSFYLEAINYIVSLDLPRSHILPIVKEHKASRVMDLNTYLLTEPDNLCLILSSDCSGLRSSSKLYDSELMSKLASLGPIQNNAAVFEKFMEKLSEDLLHENFSFYYEEGIEGSDPNSAKVVDLFASHDVLNLEQLEVSKLEEIERDYKPYNSKQLSYSKLQTYLDCPKKFYIEYVEKIKPRANFEEKIREDQLGVLEHLVIENYFKNQDRPELKSLTKVELDKFLEENKISLTQFDYERAYSEIYSFCLNGIEVLDELSKLPGFVKYEFEREFKTGDLIARIDCIAHFNEGLFVIDFKRSKFSIPTLSSITKYKKIQLPFYFERIGADKIIGAMYLCLSDVEDSLVFNTKDVGLNLSFITQKKVSLLDLSNDSYSYSSFESDLCKDLYNQKKFLAKPSSSDTCVFCVMNNICSKTDEKS